QSGWALGYIVAAAVAALFLDVLDLGDQAWRWLFAFGALPALAVVWVRREVEEPAAWQQRGTGQAAGNPFRVLVGRDLWRRTVLATLMTPAVQFAYWGLFSWLPEFLARPVDNGGAGLSIVSSLGWLIPMQIGAYFGYLSFGFIAERFGRRVTFIVFLVSAA